MPKKYMQRRPRRSRPQVEDCDAKRQRVSTQGWAEPAPHLIDQTLSIWQPHSALKLSREDGREIVDNLTGFFRILAEWDRADRLKATEACDEI